MADKKISELDAITGAATAADDYFIVVDSSGAATKKISREELNNAIEQDVLSVVDINGGTIDGTVIGGSSAAAGTFTALSATGLGVGTSSPSGLLHVSSGGTTRVFIEGSDGKSEIRANNGNLSFFTNQDANVSGLNTTVFYRNGANESMRITSSGSLGLGTSAPAQELHLVGKARIQRSTNANLEITSDNNTGASPFVVGTNSDTFFLKNQAASGFGTGGNFIQYDEGGSLRLMGTDYIDSSGNFGINTTPSYRLHISNGSSTGTAMQLQTTGSGHNFDMVDGTGTARFRNVNGEMRLYGDLNSGGNGNIVFVPQGTTERMRLDSSGRLGLGTSSPASKAHIVGSSNDTVSQANANLNIEGAGGNGIVVGTISSSPYSSYLQSGFVDNFGTATYPISLNPLGGHVSIGPVTPAYRLDVAVVGGSIARFSNGSSGGTPSTTHSEVIVESGEPNMGIQLLGTATSNQRILFGDSGSAGVGKITYDHTSNYMSLTANGTEVMRLDNSGRLLVGSTSITSSLGAKATFDGTVFSDTENRAANPTFAFAHDNFSSDSNNFIMLDRTSEAMRFNVAGSERLRIDNLGNIGIGTASLSTYGGKLSIVDGAIGGETTLVLANNSQDQFARLGINNNEAQIAWDNADALVFGTATTSATAGLTSEFARIDSSGRLGIQVSSPATELDMTDGTLRTKYVQGGYGNINGNFHADSKAGTAGIFYMNWFAGTGGASVGNGSSGYGTIRASAFTVSSDKRLKENISYFDSGLDKILQLKPATFDFINGENNQKGFIAQDVETVIPEVVGTTTMPDSDGIVDESDTYLTINSSAMIPYLVAAIQEQQVMIQEQQSIIESFEARIAALETA